MKISQLDPANPITPNALRLIGRKTGLLSDVPLYHRQRSDPEFYPAQARTNDVGSLLVADVDRWRVGGGQRTLSDSMMSVAGELAERYCSHRQYHWEPLLASYRELREKNTPVVPFEYLDVYPQVAYDRIPQLTPFTRDTPLQWHEGTDLTSGDRVFVPAQLIYNVAATPDAPDRFVSTSSGCACGETMASALRGAICELIERDAFVRTWFLDRTPDRIDLSDAPELAALKRTLEHEYLEFVLLNYESPIDIPTVGCAVVDTRKRNPKFVIAGGADVRTEDAIEDALVEGAQVWTNHRREFARLSDLEFDPETSTGLLENVHYYSLHENFEQVEPLLSGGAIPADELSSGAATLGELVELLEAGGFTPIAFDLTSRDIEQLGWHVCRVVIPELIDFTPPSMPPLDHPDLEGASESALLHPFG